MKISEIEETITGQESVTDSKLFLDKCTSCGVCTRACAFLGTRGKPNAVVSRPDQDIFLCTSCGACNSLCPVGLAPADALLSVKHRLIESGRIPETVSQALRSSRRFVRWGSSFPFSFHSRTETVFWPGCSLAGMAPDVVLKTRGLLSEKLGEKVGLALDCCGDPVYELGDLGAARARMRGIEQTLQQHGTTEIIAACANCIKVFRRYLPDMNVRHVLEVLPQEAFRGLPQGSSIYLHHPCPSYCFESIQASARRLCAGPGSKIIEQPRAQCCGQGGGLPALSPESANACTAEILHAAGNAALVTYCMGCKDQFLRQGRKAYHLLELLVAVPAAERPISSARKWLNRLLLALKAHLVKGTL
jgi:Fe-S oxidoreductase